MNILVMGREGCITGQVMKLRGLTGSGGKPRRRRVFGVIDGVAILSVLNVA